MKEMIHDIKCIEPFYSEAEEGKKSFELRKNDRNYKVGDILCQWQFVDGQITGKNFCQKVIYLLQDFTGLVEGFCIMGVERTEGI